MTTLAPDVARRRFVLLTGLRWLRMGPVAAMLVVLLRDRGLTLAQVGVSFAVAAGVAAAGAVLVRGLRRGPDTGQAPDAPIGQQAAIAAP